MKKIALASATVIALFGLAACASSTSGPKKVSGNHQAQSSSKAAQTFKVGDTVDLNGVHLRVNKVDFNAGSDVSVPKAGNQYVIVNVTITNESKESVNCNSFDFKLDDTGNQTDLYETVMDDSGNDVVADRLDSETLEAGGSSQYEP